MNLKIRTFRISVSSYNAYLLGMLKSVIGYASVTYYKWTSLYEITCIWKLYPCPCEWTQREHCCRISPFLCLQKSSLDHHLTARPPVRKPQDTFNAGHKKKKSPVCVCPLWKINHLGLCCYRKRIKSHSSVMQPHTNISFLTTTCLKVFYYLPVITEKPHYMFYLDLMLFNYFKEFSSCYQLCYSSYKPPFFYQPLLYNLLNEYNITDKPQGHQTTKPLILNTNPIQNI